MLDHDHEHNHEQRPFFENIKSFADVPVHTDGVDAHAFLEASDGLVHMFDLLGSAVFGFVQHDIKTNIRDIRTHYEQTQCPKTIQVMVSSGWENRGALVRLVRGLAFTCAALQAMQASPTQELHVCFKTAYDKVLRHHHSFVIRSVVYVALRAVPHRNDFYARISQGASHDKLDEELKKWLCGLDCIVGRLKIFLKDGGFGVV